MTTITAYTYEAATHCITCTLLRFRCDESLLDACEDREGNAPHPVFSTDAEPDGYCDTCGLAYGNAHPVAPLLSVEAWRTPEGGWDWNTWHRRGMVPLAWCDLKPRAMLRALRNHGGAYPAPGLCAIEDDGFNVVIVMRGTREPIAAIAYGEAQR